MRRAALAGCALLALALVAGLWLHGAASRRSARWLEVELPPEAAAGERVPVRVTLRDPPADARLVVDLHGLTTRREPSGLVGRAGSQPTAKETRTYTFEASLREDPALGYVMAVVYLSSSGRWQERSAAAVTEPIPVRPNARTALPRAIATHELSAGARDAAPDSAPLRIAVAVLWLLCAAVAARRGRERGAHDAAAGRRSGLALACVAAGLWEGTGADAWIAGLARELALEQRLYYQRRSLQEWLTMAALLGASALALARLRPGRARGPDPVQAALWLYAGLSLARLLSWHELDRLLAAPVASLPFVQVAKLATVLVALAYAARARAPRTRRA